MKDPANHQHRLELDGAALRLVADWVPAGRALPLATRIVDMILAEGNTSQTSPETVVITSDEERRLRLRCLKLALAPSARAGAQKEPLAVAADFLTFVIHGVGETARLPDGNLQDNNG